MYKKTLKNANRNAKLIMWLLFAGGVFLFLFAGREGFPYPAFAQTVSIVMLGLAIYIASSYVLKEYTVEVFFPTGEGADLSKSPDFAIYEQRGKRRITVCLISLSEVEYIEILTDENKKEIKEKVKSMKRYRYNTFFCQTKFIHIVTRDGISVCCTYDDGLYCELCKYI